MVESVLVMLSPAFCDFGWCVYDIKTRQIAFVNHNSATLASFILFSDVVVSLINVAAKVRHVYVLPIFVTLNKVLKQR